MLDPDHSVLAGRPAERILEAYVFGSQGNRVRDVTSADSGSSATAATVIAT